MISIICFALLSLPLAAQSEIIKLEAVASYYGEEFQGRPTSSGEIFDMNALTAAHKTLPFGTILEVTNLENGRKSVVRVNDRGPFVAGRELDVSKAAAYELGMVSTGTARVSIRRIGGSGSDSIAPADGTQVASATAATSAPAVSAAPVVTTAPAATTTIPADAPASQEAPQQMSGQWRIQLGSFSKEENATRLSAQLIKDGFTPAFERNGTMIRVVIAGIPANRLPLVKNKLDSAGYGTYLVREE
jgi:rare lipoprotein A